MSSAATTCRDVQQNTSDTHAGDTPIGLEAATHSEPGLSRGTVLKAHALGFPLAYLQKMPTGKRERPDHAQRVSQHVYA